MKTKLLSIAMMVALILAAITRGQAQQFDGPCLPQMHGLDGHQSALCSFTQTIAFSAGTNWFSTYVEITLEDLQDALVAALPGTSITIRAKDNKYTTYTGTRWRGTLNSLDVALMYTIKTSAACEIELEGAPINPADHPITIMPGANWIGCPYSEGKSLTEAFAGFVVNGDNVKDKSNKYATYTNRWRGTLTNLVPGQGYIYNSAATETRTLVYPTGAK